MTAECRGEKNNNFIFKKHNATKKKKEFRKINNTNNFSYLCLY